MSAINRFFRRPRRSAPAPTLAPPIHVPPMPPPLAAEARVIKVADASEGPWHPRMYSYWANAWVSTSGHVYVFAGHADGYPRLFTVHLALGRVERTEGVLPQYPGTTEGWSWDDVGTIHLTDDPRLLAADPFGRDESVLLDITDSHPGCRLWQAHVAGSAACATVERVVSDGPYPRVGTIARWHGRESFYPAEGRLDESQVTAHGWLVIKEERWRDAVGWRLDNRVVNLETGEDYWIRDEAGAVGHSDCEGDRLVGEDDHDGACVQWDLRARERRHLFPTWKMGHVSLRAGRCLLSDDERIALVDLETGAVTPVINHGEHVIDYDSQVRANLDPSGRVATYMAGGSIYLLVL